MQFSLKTKKNTKIKRRISIKQIEKQKQQGLLAQKYKNKVSNQNIYFIITVQCNIILKLQTHMFKTFFDDQKYLEGDIKLQNLQINNEIGRGNSDVYLGLLNQSKIAIKQTQIKSDYEYHNFLQEISILKNLSQNTNSVIKYQGYFVTITQGKPYNSKKYGYLLMERAQMNLFELIRDKKQSKSRICTENIFTITHTLLSGFNYLQSVNIAHCDIKPENILVTTSSPFQVKICDVGSCKMISKDSQSQATIKGTLSFLAPELVRIQTIKITSINPFRSDVYSFGLVLLYLITGKKFNSLQRKQVSEEVYHEIICEWIKQAGEILNESCIIDILKRALQFDQYKRPLFKDLYLLYDSLIKKKKALKQNKIKKLTRKQTENESIQTKKQTLVVSEQAQKTKLPQIKLSSSSTLISFHSRQRLTGKISAKNTKSPANKKSSQKSNQKYRKQSDRSKSRISPFQKTTMYSTFSIDKSKISIQNENRKIIYVTNENFNMIPYQSINQEEKIFVLLTPNILFDSAQSVVIKKQCSIQVFDKLSNIKTATNFYLEYPDIEVFGPDQNTPTIQSFQSVYINLQNSMIEGGYNNLLRCLCPITLKNLFLQLSGSQITFQEVKSEIERIKNKQLSKLDLCWDKAPINFQNFVAINQKISKLPLKKLILSFGSAYMKPAQKSRWLLPSKCKLLYLNFPNNFLAQILGNLSLSLAEQTQLKQFYLNLENNCLTDIDIKVLTKSLKSVENLQKAILNFSYNNVEKGRYCFEDIKHLNKISSLQLRISKCGIKFQQFKEILFDLARLFQSSLKILKLTYDRSIPKSVLYLAVDKIMNQFNQSFKIDIFGYDSSFYMIYIKKKSPQVQKSIKIRAKNSSNHVLPFKTTESSTNLPINRSISNNLNSQNSARIKQQQDQFPNLPTLKQGGSEKVNLPEKICEAFYSTYPTYQCYICLGCIQNKETAKFEYFCRACIESCQHKGHNIVRTYEKKVCNCPYNNKCCFGNNLPICAQKLGLKYKKQYECQKCSQNKSACEYCIAECEEAHPEYVQYKSSGYFQCDKQNI